MGKQDIVFAGGHEDLDWTCRTFLTPWAQCPPNTMKTGRIPRRAPTMPTGTVSSLPAAQACWCLKSWNTPRRAGAKIYGEIVGYGATSDGYDMVAPSGEGAVRCMKLALSTVDTPVDYINTHGTSTPIGDSREIGAIREVFGTDMPHIASTKSLTGHSLGATGVQESIYSLLMLKEGFIIGESAHIQTLDPEFEGVPIVRERIDDAKIDTVLSNSFGFGGTNATLIFRRHEGVSRFHG